MLWRPHLAGGIAIAFWKGSAYEDVEFVVRERGNVARLIQVCWDLADPRTRAREFRALLKASEELSCQDLCFLSRESASEELFSWYGRTDHIKIVPIEQWLQQE